MLARIASAACLLSLTACLGDPPTLTGTVVDLWGNPVSGVEVTLNPEGKTATTNGKGEYSLPIKKGEFKVRAAGEGFIAGEQDITVTDITKKNSVDVRVIPEPETDGFHVVGPESYLKLAPQQVERQGNDLKAWQGMRGVGDTEVDGKELRIVFHTPLKMDEVARLGIKLHKLNFVENTKVATVEGEEEISLNLWTDAGDVEWEREELGSDDNYVFRANELPSGTYAIVSMNLLSSLDAAAFDKIPASVRRVHTFTVK
jgi:hypothetical protein